MTSNASSTGKTPNQNYRNYKRFLLVLLVLIGITTPLCAQSKQQLEKDKARVEQEIKKLSSDLAKAKKDSRNSQRQLQLLERQIAQRTSVINNISGQLNLLGIQITQTQDSIVMLRSQVDSLKREYARVVRVLYAERDNLAPLPLLLDTPSYNRSYLRTKYFRDYSRYRRRQAGYIRQQEDLLNEAGLQLARQQQQTTNLLNEQRRHRQQLASEQSQRQKTLSRSRQQEKSLQQQIDKKEQQRRQLQQQIQRIINEEIARANKAKKEQVGSQGKTAAASSAAETALSADFVSNKGRLPWPVTYSKVLREYGRYTHASGGQNFNNGIDLQCRSGAPVQAVFQGTVSRVFTTPGGTKGIIIRHGNYLTVYANLATVTVSQGATVSTRQNLGTVYTDSNGIAEFSFQLWNGTSSLNPRSWLK